MALESLLEFQVSGSPDFAGIQKTEKQKKGSANFKGTILTIGVIKLIYLVKDLIFNYCISDIDQNCLRLKSKLLIFGRRMDHLVKNRLFLNSKLVILNTFDPMNAQ